MIIVLLFSISAYEFYIVCKKVFHQLWALALADPRERWQC